MPVYQAVKAAALPVCRAIECASSRLSVWSVDIAVLLDEWSLPPCGPDKTDAARPGCVLPLYAAELNGPAAGLLVAGPGIVWNPTCPIRTRGTLARRGAGIGRTPDFFEGAAAGRRAS
ncbi:hypothetical protein GCM10010278_85980 [Streptomyces melanogenes]|nr:hypothetical protein GCM10010278_85980 [Streptomyces melanogenes]